MLRYTTLVALYDIRPGNGAGQFLQPRSPHGRNGDGKLCGEGMKLWRQSGMGKNSRERSGDGKKIRGGWVGMGCQPLVPIPSKYW